jgi:hypothetical protein
MWSLAFDEIGGYLVTELQPYRAVVRMNETGKWVYWVELVSGELRITPSEKGEGWPSADVAKRLALQAIGEARLFDG